MIPALVSGGSAMALQNSYQISKDANQYAIIKNTVKYPLIESKDKRFSKTQAMAEKAVEVTEDLNRKANQILSLNKT